MRKKSEPNQGSQVERKRKHTENGQSESFEGFSLVFKLLVLFIQIDFQFIKFGKRITISLRFRLALMSFCILKATAFCIGFWFSLIRTLKRMETPKLPESPKKSFKIDVEQIILETIGQVQGKFPFESLSCDPADGPRPFSSPDFNQQKLQETFLSIQDGLSQKEFECGDSLPIETLTESVSSLVAQSVNEFFETISKRNTPSPKRNNRSNRNSKGAFSPKKKAVLRKQAAQFRSKPQGLSHRGNQ